MKTNENQLLDKLTVILRKYAGEESNIESNTQIEADLSITGDDAYDLINELRKEFMLDISTFHFNKYFCPEPNTLWVVKVPINKKELTVQDLVIAIQIGKLETKSPN